MKFGDGYAASLDVTAHELTHAITDRTADLEYKCQSGALNESMSDIFASNVDSDDWEIGEDLPGGALRDMAHPENGHPPQPGNVRDFVEMPNDGNPYNDSGGVHYNSGIPNRAYYLMVQSIGRKAAEQIVYRALTEKLEPDSGFEDFRTASLDVARELWGEDSPEFTGTNESFAAVGLDGTWEAPEVEGC
jgi:Zn-dependent metalloprotease